MWLAHHWPDEVDRCVVLGHRHVCRRCAVLYPMAVAVMAMVLALPSLASACWAPWLMMLAPIPVTLEWIAEHSFAMPYRPRRQMLVTALAAPALGLGFARYLRSPGDRWFWTMVAVIGGICVLSALLPSTRPRPRSPARADCPTVGDVGQLVP